MSIKIAVVGNCQARPIAQLLQQMNPNIEVTTTAIVHLLKTEEEPQYAPFLEQSDMIIAQLVADNYPCEFVRSQNLRQKYGNKVDSIVNLYFSGYNPELRYVKLPGSGLLDGPLGAYHIQTVLDSWLEGAPTETAASRVESIEYNQKKYDGLSEKSLNDLRQREKNASVPIVDHIEANMSERKLFFTFNHPSALLMQTMIQRLLAQRGISIDSSAPPSVSKLLNEPLNVFTLPVNCYIAEQMQLKFDNPPIYKGRDVTLENNRVVPGGPKTFDLFSITQMFYQIYDANKDALHSVYSVS